MWPLATNAKTVKTSLGGEPVDITILPDLVIENIFEHVVESDGDCAILNLSLVCRRWKDIVASNAFRRKVHFQWLSKVYNWKKASSNFKEQYFVMYSIRECLGCDRLYKDMPGFRGSGKGTALAFYSEDGDAGHPGYCNLFCAIRYGNYWDSFESDWEAANEIAQRNEGELGNEAIE